MTVSELIAFRQTQPQDLPVVYRCCSEYAILEPKAIEVEELCVDREDGWVPRARPDRARRTYLVFPGN